MPVLLKVCISASRDDFEPPQKNARMNAGMAGLKARSTDGLLAACRSVLQAVTHFELLALSAKSFLNFVNFHLKLTRSGIYCQLLKECRMEIPDVVLAPAATLRFFPRAPVAAKRKERSSFPASGAKATQAPPENDG
jgi:hypothetical protein